MHSIKENAEKVKERIAVACARAGRDPRGVTVVAVTKERTIEDIEALAEAGFSAFGERRVREAAEKWREHRPSAGELHLIGHLQSNKVKKAVELFDVIQSVDGIDLLRKIVESAEKLQKKMRVFIQINAAKDPKKFGIFPEEVLSFFREANPLLVSRFVKIEGLMAIAENTGDVEARRPAFKKMKEIFDDLRAIFEPGHIESVEMKFLSMGMSDDFEVAIEEGANMIRLGRVFWRS